VKYLRNFFHAKNRRVATLRGVFLVALLVFLPSLLLQLLIADPPAENFFQPNPLFFFLFAFLTLFLVTVLPRKRSLFLGISLGGIMSNYFMAHFLPGPVFDYLLVPGSADHYFNLPDLAILLGSVLYALFALLELWALEKETWKKKKVLS
jgi:hypothetical protein